MYGKGSSNWLCMGAQVSFLFEQSILGFQITYFVFAHTVKKYIYFLNFVFSSTLWQATPEMNHSHYTPTHLYSTQVNTYHIMLFLY